MNIWLFSPTDPRLHSYGGEQRTHYLWEALSRIGNVITIVPVAHRSFERKDSKDKIFFICFERRYSISWIAQRIMRRIAPFLDWHRARSASKLLRHNLPKPDICIARFMSMAAGCAPWLYAKSYVDIDDLPTESFRCVYKGKYNPFVGSIIECFVKKWMERTLQHFDGAWVANPSQAFGLPCKALPLLNLSAMPKCDYMVHGKQKLQLMTVGYMAHKPNFEGVDWFLREIWPKVISINSNVKYVVAGKGVPDELREKWKQIKNVSILGYVEDIDSLYEESLAVVTPILSGAGTCCKIPEAGMRGRIVLATPFALRGLSIDGEGRENFVVFETAESFIKSLSIIIAEYELGELGMREERFAVMCREHFSFETFVRQVEDLICS